MSTVQDNFQDPTIRNQIFTDVITKLKLGFQQQHDLWISTTFPQIHLKCNQLDVTSDQTLKELYNAFKNSKDNISPDINQQNERDYTSNLESLINTHGNILLQIQDLQKTKADLEYQLSQISHFKNPVLANFCKYDLNLLQMYLHMQTHIQNTHRDKTNIICQNIAKCNQDMVDANTKKNLLQLACVYSPSYPPITLNLGPIIARNDVPTEEPNNEPTEVSTDVSTEVLTADEPTDVPIYEPIGEPTTVRSTVQIQHHPKKNNPVLTTSNMAARRFGIDEKLLWDALNPRSFSIISATPLGTFTSSPSDKDLHKIQQQQTKQQIAWARFIPQSVFNGQCPLCETNTILFSDFFLKPISSSLNLSTWNHVPCCRFCHISQFLLPDSFNNLFDIVQKRFPNNRSFLIHKPIWDLNCVLHVGNPSPVHIFANQNIHDNIYDPHLREHDNLLDENQEELIVTNIHTNLVPNSVENVIPNVLIENVIPNGVLTVLNMVQDARNSVNNRRRQLDTEQHDQTRNVRPRTAVNDIVIGQLTSRHHLPLPSTIQLLPGNSWCESCDQVKPFFAFHPVKQRPFPPVTVEDISVRCKDCCYDQKWFCQQSCHVYHNKTVPDKKCPITSQRPNGNPTPVPRRSAQNNNNNNMNPVAINRINAHRNNNRRSNNR